MRSALALIASLLVFSITSQASECFFSNDIRGFRARDSRTVDLQSYSGIVYRAEVGFCWNIQQARQIRFDRSWVCAGDDLIIVNNFNGGFEDRCWIQDIRRIN